MAGITGQGTSLPRDDGFGCDRPHLHPPAAPTCSPSFQRAIRTISRASSTGRGRPRKPPGTLTDRSAPLRHGGRAGLMRGADQGHQGDEEATGYDLGDPASPPGRASLAEAGPRIARPPGALADAFYAVGCAASSSWRQHEVCQCACGPDSTRAESPRAEEQARAASAPRRARTARGPAVRERNDDDWRISGPRSTARAVVSPWRRLRSQCPRFRRARNPAFVLTERKDAKRWGTLSSGSGGRLPPDRFERESDATGLGARSRRFDGEKTSTT